jgi:hypothetical protein
MAFFITGIFQLFIIQHDQVKEDEMGRACSPNRGEEERMYDIGGKARRKGTTGKTKAKGGRKY